MCRRREEQPKPAWWTRAAWRGGGACTLHSWLPLTTSQAPRRLHGSDRRQWTGRKPGNLSVRSISLGLEPRPWTLYPPDRGELPHQLEALGAGVLKTKPLESWGSINADSFTQKEATPWGVGLLPGTVCVSVEKMAAARGLGPDGAPVVTEHSVLSILPMSEGGSWSHTETDPRKAKLTAWLDGALSQQTLGLQPLARPVR